MTAFVTTANAVALPVDAVPVVDVEQFRRDVLGAAAQGRRLLLLTGLPENGSTRLVAALADDAGGDIGLTSCLAMGEYPTLTPDCPSAHYFEREIFESSGLRPEAILTSPAGVRTAAAQWSRLCTKMPFRSAIPPSRTRSVDSALTRPV